MQTSKFTTDAEQLAALAAPFPPDCHKQRDEAGKTFTYLEHTSVAQRLRDVLGTGLNITTGQVIHRPDISLNDPVYGYVDLEVVIEATFVSGQKMMVAGWGEADVVATKQLTPEQVEQGKKRGRAGSPFKSAFSDGLKVAATRLGVGAYLYSEEGREGIEQAQKAQKEADQQRALLTCQECSNPIQAGEFNGVIYGDPVEFVNAVRKVHRRRLCLTCVQRRETI